MRLLLSVALLSSVLQLCSAAPVRENLNCAEVNNATAGHLAIHHINDNHDHGYKFKIDEVTEVDLKMVDHGCDIELQLLLKETACHTISPRDFEECPERSLGERAVVANCSVLITVKDNDAKVSKYDCETRQELTNLEMVRICPDCPMLVPLNDPEGLKSIREAVTEFNKNTSNEHVFVLQEVGRIKAAYIMSAGMNYYAEFTLVETVCPRESRIMHEACKPMCPDRAEHAFCRSSYSKMNGLYSVECEFYPAKNTDVLGPGEQEPICSPFPPNCVPVPPPHPPRGHGRNHGPPAPPAHGHGPPAPPAHGHGPPAPPAHGHGPPQRPPPTQEKHLPRPPFPHFPCFPPMTRADPAIHPICPWPQRRVLPMPGPGCMPLGPKNN
ncbi:LOW QUALITY PROTEIN: alpha-2-HS-glycoprotein 1 [Takifugu flavidus]|uniref:LOW QUALITY PROTEIN: alpha-2-HS-glycoprotein 1 n=1 Tax=Takifugu flavidus TaxID=433684 RepID=UPI002544473D|nr:LOW QUALITY PROTEIN: alpha-2-HS-glycoprotein 1 [Takifugu flavidus]